MQRTSSRNWEQISFKICPRGIFRALSNIYDGTFLSKQLTNALTNFTKNFIIMSDMVLNSPFYLRFAEMNYRLFSNRTVLNFSNLKSFGPLSEVLSFNKTSCLRSAMNSYYYLISGRKKTRKLSSFSVYYIKQTSY